MHQLPQYPEMKLPPYKDWWRHLVQIVKTKPIAALQAEIAAQEALLAEYPRCEYTESSTCNGAAVCVCHGIPCCETHAKIRGDYFK